MKKIVIGTTFLGFLGCIPAANFLVEHHAPIAVWPSILAPAGVLVAGIAFTARDVLQRVAGRGAVLLAVALGVGVSFLLAAPALAFASAAAFLSSELLDMAVFSRLEKRTFTGAVVLSNVVAAFVDSAVFLLLAFGSLAFFPGQVIGKLLMTALALLVIVPFRIREARQA